MSRHHGTILFVSHEATRTGAPLFLLRYLRWLRENRDIRFCILTGRAGELYTDFESLATTELFEPRTISYRILRRLKLHRRILRSHLARLREKLARKNISLIYVNSVVSAEMLEYLAFLECPVVCHVHELEGAIKNIAPQIMRTLKRRTTMYIAVSRAVQINLVERHGIAKEQIQIIENFISVPEDATLCRERARALVLPELGIPYDAKIVCACGTIHFNKGTDLFLQVAHRVTKEFRSCPVHFVWLGDSRGSEKAKYTKQARSIGLKDLVHFAGQRIEVAPYFAAADIFLMTSRAESFGLVMLEAALQQKPIICFDHIGYPPDFVEQDAGFVAPDFDPDKMSIKLMQLLASPDLCRRMGMAAKKKVLERHTMAVGAVKITTVIEQLASH